MSSYHGVSDGVHQANVTTLSGRGYRPISLAVAGGLAGANYSAVWLQAAGPNWVAAHGMTTSQYNAARLNWALQGFRPQIVSASGSGTDVVWAAVYVQDGVSVSHQTDMTLAAFESDAATKRDTGHRLVSCATYGTSVAPRFAPVYEQVDDVAWGWEADDDGVAFPDHATTHADAGHRPAFLGMRNASTYLSIWHDDRVGAWAWVAGRTSAQFASDKLAMQAAGLYPLSIAAGGTGTATRFSGVFVERLTAYARTLTHSGAASLPLAALDQMMDGLVVRERVRSATLAVIRNGCLVHTRAFGYAEPGYPQATPTSLFRIGSISKPVCGLVAHDLVESGVGGFSLNTNMVNTLGIRTSNSIISGIDLQQLLTHSSGFAQGVDELQAAIWANRSNPVMPPDESVIVGYAATAVPTLPGYWNYSNAGLTAVGQMIEAVTRQDYPVALQTRLLAPLGITRFVRQQGPRNLLWPGEVEYHLRRPYLRSGNLYVDQRLLAPQYSQRFWDSAGGAVTSAVDLARILAGSFQIGADSPVFGVQAQAAILNHRTYPEVGTGNPMQWTDGSWVWSEFAPGEYVYDHDGAQDGFRAYCMFRTDGIGVVTLFNGDGRGGLGLHQMRSRIQTAIDGVTTWPTVDLFPNYGLPSFPRTPQLGSHLPSTVPNVSTQPIVFFGSNLDQVTSVLFDGVPLRPALSTAWATGYIDRISDTVLHVYPPQGIRPDQHTVRAFTAATGGNTVSVPFRLTPSLELAAQDYVIGGASPFPVLVARGPLSSRSWTMLGISVSTLPSVAPGLVSLGIGNQFTNLVTTDLRAFDPTTATARWDFPGLMGLPYAYLQAIAIDFGAMNQTPLPTTNVWPISRR